MTEHQSIGLISLIGFLVLLVSALSVRKFTFSFLVRTVLGWALIAGVAYLVVINRAQLAALAADLGDRIGIPDSQRVEGETVRIQMAEDGHFWARVTLNGVRRRMLVDSGATITALSAETANAAGVEIRAGGIPVQIATANGIVMARRARVAKVDLGPLSTGDLPVVISPAFGELDVLGMNFLSRLGSWRVEG
jgi:aspartyl protease family protein